MGDQQPLIAHLSSIGSVLALVSLILRHAKAHKTAIAAVFVLQLISTIAALALPSMNARIIDVGIATGDTDFIWATGLKMLGVCLLQVTTAIGGVFFGARTAMAIGAEVRRELFRKVGSLSALELGRFGSATLITRGTNDVQQVQMLVLMLLNFMVSTPIMCIGGIVMALREDAGLSWLVWVSVPVLFVIVGILVFLLMPLFRLMQDRIDGINSVLREQIIGIRVVRAFGREPFESERYREANRKLTRVSVRVGNIFVLMFPIIMMVLHVATGAVLWFGGHRVDAGNVDVGSLTAFLQYLLQILVAVMMGVFMVMMVPRAIVCAERITEVLGTDSSQKLPSEPSPVVPTRGRVEFRNVTFGYPGAEKPVLDNISFVAEPGRTTAIVGSTGAGKTSLINLVARLYDPQSGQVLIDGVDVADLTRAQLSGVVGLVSQRPYLFSGTIASNLRFGRTDASDEELWHALRIAQGEEFVREKDKGLESPVAQGGANVSGGQRQRLCIARALVAKPRLYLFDDSFSALDVATDSRLRAALPEATADATVIIVAQRISTITGADQILVINDGVLVGNGRHEDLLESNETYRQIVESQLSVEEVA